MVLSKFVEFLKELNITQMVIGMVISTALADLVKTLIEEFVKPATDRIVIPDKNVPSPKVWGEEIDISAITTKVVGVFASLIFAFLIFIVFKH